MQLEHGWTQKGTFEPDVARRVLLEQGMDSFVEQLEAAGAL